MRASHAAAFDVKVYGRSFWEKLRGGTGRWVGLTMYAFAHFHVILLNCVDA